MIDKTNQYIAKYQVNNFNGVNLSSNDIIMTHSQNNFLKKGNGVGGGKTVLEIIPNVKQINKNVQSRINSIHKNTYYNSNKDNDFSSMSSKNKNNKKDKIDILLSNCL